jgi:hypothetical protein
MNRRYFVMIHACILILVIPFLAACNDTIDQAQDDSVRGVNVIPNPVEVGQTISISGPNFKDATAVVFPDNITVSTFDKVGEMQLNAVVPAGIKEGGHITVQLPDGDFVIPVAINLLKPEVTETYAQSGAPNLGQLDALVLKGRDLINVNEIIFPGEAQPTVKTMDFKRLGAEEIIVIVPLGTAKEIAPVTLKTHYGTVFTSGPIDFTGGGYVAPIYLLLCGADGEKAWVFDKSNIDRWWYMTDTDPTAFWWQPDPGPADETGRMVFGLSNDFTYYASPTADPVGGTTWTVNDDWTELKLSGEANILGVEGGGEHVDGSKDFRILEITDDRLVLFSTPVVWSPGWVWVFKSIVP